MERSGKAKGEDRGRQGERKVRENVKRGNGEKKKVKSKRE
jgi:hypothetical protein